MYDEKELFFENKLRIEKFLDNLLSIKTPNKLQEAMRYSVLVGGKRLRPSLTYITSELGPKQIKSETVDVVAASVELIHCYSLIHDDLPSMDDDSLRRGNPTCHVAFGEDIAILAGDALQTLSTDIIVRCPDLSDNEKVNILKEISSACGWSGMVEGQLIDISNDRSLKEEDLDNMHKKKTGELIKASLVVGCILSGINKDQIKIIKDYGEKIGLAFQIIDDLIDLEDSNTTGKEGFSDMKNGRITYPSLLGSELSLKKAQKLTEEAKGLLETLDLNTDKLSSVANYLVKRNF
tara:strand:+ start:535 stop:1413 length:879 start_codon:yes stop_codon:yes gene_type:complete